MGLDAIAAFNASFDNNGAEHSGCGIGIDPQLLSNASSPASNYTTPLFNNDESNAGPEIQGAIGQNATSNNYPPPRDFSQTASASTPYFHRSIETPNVPAQQSVYIPSSLRNQLHRRSVSEPPAGFPDHLSHPKMPAQAMVTFHREGLSLGTPTLQNGTLTRSIARSRHPHRQQPNPIVNRGGMERHQLRRTQTQPVHVVQGPTSVPTMNHIPPPQSPQMMMQQPVVPGLPFVSSRVCTPAPSPEREQIVASPTYLDETRGAEPPAKKRAVAISMSVDELRVLMTEAVHVALKEFAGGRKSVIPRDGFVKEVGDGGEVQIPGG